MAPDTASIVSTLVSLLVIFGALGALAFVLGKLRNGGWSRPGAAPARIQIIASRSIGWQSALLIVEADGQRFLVGSGRAGLTPIGALADRHGDFAAALNAANQSPPAP